MIKDNQIWKIYGTDYKAITKELLEQTDLAGFIRSRFPTTAAAAAGTALTAECPVPLPADTPVIGIKPNLVCPSPAEFGGTTHPEVVAGIIEYLREKSFDNILIVEGSWVGDRTSEAYEYCGYRALCGKYNIPFIDGQKEKYHEVDCRGMKLNLIDAVDRIDFLINVPVLKGHCQTKVTCALKNMKGLLPNTEKRRFHQMGLHRPIAYLSTVLKGDFIVIDHICGDLDFEEGGNPVVRNCVMAALDPVLTDSYACYLMHYTPDDVPYIRLAEELGTGTADLDRAEIIRLNSPAEAFGASGAGVGSAGKRGQGQSFGLAEETDRELPQDSEGARRYRIFEEADEELPREHKVLSVSYAVDDADSCSACYASLVPALYRLEEEGLLSKLTDRIAIGQGQQGKTGPLGIGRCTKDFDFCIMGCPPSEEQVYEELKRYIRESMAK